MEFSPSLYAHILGGGVLFAGMVYALMCISKIISRDPYQILVIILLFSIAIGVHGLSHVGLESVYGYNPLSVFTGK